MSSSDSSAPLRGAGSLGGRLEVPDLRHYITVRHALGLLRWAGWRLRYPRQRFPLFWIGRRATIVIAPGGRLEIGRGVIFHDDVTLHVHGVLRVGDRSLLGRGVFLDAAERIEIGSDCGLGEWTTCHDGQHVPGPGSIPFMQRPFRSDPVVVEDNVWIGAKVSLQGGVRVGHDSVIGSNAVVTKDIPPCTVSVGVPARVVKHLGEDV